MERSRQDLSGNIWVVALIVYRFRDKRKIHHRYFLRLSRNRLTINATTHTLIERIFQDLSENVWVVAEFLVVALIVCRFREKTQKTEMILLKWGRSLTESTR